MVKSDFKKRALYNLIFLISLGGLFFLIFSTAKEFLKVKKIDNEINELQKEITEIENKNLKLSELLKYFDSNAFAEKKARTELGLKKPDEKVVIIPQNQQNQKLSPQLQINQKIKKSNLIIWLDYFLKNN